MDKKLSILSALTSSLPLLFVLGAIFSFAVGFCAHKLLGDNNPIEEIAEDILEKEYNIDVEFSGHK